MKTIIWTEPALKDYHENIDYLISQWSEKVALEFIDDVNNILFNLRIGNVKCSNSDYRGVRVLVIRKQVTLYYCDDKPNIIELLRFWNNHSDKKKLHIP